MKLVESSGCPALDCAESHQITLSHSCCKVCKGKIFWKVRFMCMSHSRRQFQLTGNKTVYREVFSKDYGIKIEMLPCLSAGCLVPGSKSRFLNSLCVLVLSQHDIVEPKLCVLVLSQHDIVENIKQC